MAYVDLNPVRAKIAVTLEESEFTSAFDRLDLGGNAQEGYLTLTELLLQRMRE